MVVRRCIWLRQSGASRSKETFTQLVRQLLHNDAQGFCTVAEVFGLKKELLYGGGSDDSPDGCDAQAVHLYEFMEELHVVQEEAKESSTEMK